MANPTIPTPRKSGQRGPAHQPTPELRLKVKSLAGYGLPQADIARLIDTDPETLRKHYRDDLDTGLAQASAGVAGSLYSMATRGKVPAAAIYWTKARMGWSEFSAEFREMQKRQEEMLAELAALRAGKADPA